MKRFFSLIAFVLLIATAAPAPASTDTGTWNEFGIRKALPRTWYLWSDIQFRTRDDFSDFYWFRWEGGPGFKPASWMDLRVMFRVNPVEVGPDDWSTRYYVMIDPVFQLYKGSNWTCDFRTRLHQKLDEGRSFLRLRPRLIRAFQAGRTASTWYVYDDVRIQTTALGSRDRVNVNWLASGFTFRLWGNTDLGLGWLLESSQGSGGKWNHLNVLNTSLVRRF